MRCIVAMTGLLLALGARAGNDDCKYMAESDDRLAMADARLVHIDAGAGFLRVKGVSGAREVSVEAQACATSKKLLDEVRWSLARSGDEIRLETDLPKTRNHHYAYVHLTVTVPEGTDMDIVDTSGSLKVKNVGSLRVVDSSGSIAIDNVDGSLTIDDSSGSITVANVVEHVKIMDRSGSIRVEHVGGSVLINDGSGSTTVNQVRGAVRIEEDGSGSISVADIDGDFIVQDDGSGGISHRRVAGTVDLPD